MIEVIQAGIRGKRAWITSLGKGEPIDLIVQFDTLSAIAGEL